MRFDTAEFWLFFAGVWLAYRWLPGKRFTLLLGSYGFYASGNPPFLLLLLLSTAIDYCAARRMHDAATQMRRRLWLVASVASNLGILGFFKYTNFVLDSVGMLGIVPPAAEEPWRLSTVIPLGISFYTFQTMSYSIDVYRRKLAPVATPVEFALYVAFLPQLVAGPIVRAKEFLPQLASLGRIDARQLIDGAELCLVGLFQKVVLADNIGRLVEPCYADPELYSGRALFVATFGFGIQLYCDFAAYSTIARGLGKMLGFELPENFGYPLLATNPLTRRAQWHMTMALWFRDYVYRPMGGDRGGAWRWVVNTLVLWMLFGLWHGPSWNFVAWGAISAAIVLAYRLLEPERWMPAGVAGHVLRWGGIVLVNAGTMLNSVVFRSSDMAEAALILGRMVSDAGGLEVSPLWAAGFAAYYAAHATSRRYYRADILACAHPVCACLFGVGLVAALVMLGRSGAPFYYFQF
jgi:D-alanyl-lipoteichoic acid acyltransferase DltB (MBOAT superfamily)